MAKPTAEERFWSKVDTSGECWLWTGARRDDYGRFYYLGRVMNAAKYSYEVAYGPVPEGLELDHLCRIKPCVRPSHLEPVTHQENTRRTFQ